LVGYGRSELALSATYTATVAWQRGEANFLDNRYSRRHRVYFDGGAEIVGSASPHVVPLPYSDATAIDPEEMFVASLSSCYMLWFLSLVAKRGWCVDGYHDQALGTMTPNADGKLSMSRVVLRPRVLFSGERQPARAEIAAAHEQAHGECFIANSVKTEVRCEPQWPGD
jgi:organic hydroperoxide reductase OsmC/OhrA